MEAGVGLGQRTYLGEDICQILEAKESIQFGFDGKEFEMSGRTFSGTMEKGRQN